ncbi:MAG TPA: membrane protein insertion efficiency factor YidD [Jiangellales bacterium]|nr:membrane protein insertion efficiency factor YidD [Jiangellales bacterium]
MRSPLTLVLTGLLRVYRAVVSPLYGPVCRYHPSCSTYALRAVETHGGVRGSWLAARRLARCHPWAEGGVDQVPPPGSYRWWGRVLQDDGDGSPADPPVPETPLVPEDGGAPPRHTAHPTAARGA